MTRNSLDEAAAFAGEGDFDVGGDAVAEGGDVADDADLAAAGGGGQCLEGGESGIEGFAAKGAESFVHEQHVHGKAAVVEAGKAERKGERNEELFAAGQGFGWAFGTGLVGIENGKGQSLAGEGVARCQVPEVGVGAAEDVLALISSVIIWTLITTPTN